MAKVHSCETQSVLQCWRLFMYVLLVSFGAGDYQAIPDDGLRGHMQRDHIPL